jgi:N4-gp56 family major capsid protein
VAYLTTATNNFSATVVALIQKRLEQELRGRVVHLQDATPGDWIPGTNLVRFVAYRDIAVVTGTPTPGTPPWLTEGTAPTAHDLSITYDEMSAYQAGDVVRITDVALSESPHRLVQVATERIAFHAARTLDQYMADIIKAGTSNTIFSGTLNTQTSDVAAGDVLTGLNIKAAVKVLASAAVPRFPDGYYHAIIHPAAVYGLMVDDDAGGWIDANKYTDREPLLAGELGRYAGVRFMETPYAGIQSGTTGGGTGSIDVYSTVVYGPDAWAFGDLQTLQVYVHTDPVKGTDPLNQFIEAGWKAMFGAMLLDSNGARYVRIESAGS